MIHVLVAVLVVLHGAVHLIMFGLPLIPRAKADLAANGVRPSHSWLLGETPRLAFGLALAVTLAFLVAAGAYVWRASWWPGAMLAAAGGSLVLLMLHASKYWVVGYPISIALAVAAWQAMRTA